MLRPSSFGSRPRFLVSGLFDTNNTNIIEHRDASIYILPVPVPLMECVKLILYVPAGYSGFLYLEPIRKPQKEALKEKTTNVVIPALSKSNAVQAGRLRMVLTNNLSGIGEDGYLLPQV